MERLQNNRLRKVRMAVLAGFLVGSLLLAQAPQGPVETEPAVNPEAVKALRSMSDYLGGLKQFSVRARNLIENRLESGHRVDFELATVVTVSRPNKVRVDRVGHLEQSFYYDGKTLAMYNPSHKVYATVPAPATIEQTLDYARESLGISQPVADLVYHNTFPLLMQDVNLALVMGEEFIGGVKCKHLLFSRPGVDFQIWIAASGPPLPHKYIVTDTGTPELLSITTVMSDWNVAPAAADSHFTFVPPPGAKATAFLPVDTGR